MLSTHNKKMNIANNNEIQRKSILPGIFDENSNVYNRIKEQKKNRLPVKSIALW